MATVEANASDVNPSLSTEAALAPVTAERPVRKDLETSILKPYMVRALVDLILIILMNTIRDLELPVHHTSMSCINDLMLQDVVIRVPDGSLRSEATLTTALLARLQLPPPPAPAPAPISPSTRIYHLDLKKLPEDKCFVVMTAMRILKHSRFRWQWT